ncbi:glycosyltransferase family 4 protein [Bradyrhizobium sp. USDA 4502]
MDAPKVFFDISSIVEYVEYTDRYSGIQRVVTTLVCRMTDYQDPKSLYLSYVDKNTGRHLCVDYGQLGRAVLESPARMRAAFFPRQSKRAPVALALFRRGRHPIKYLFYKLNLAPMYATTRKWVVRQFGSSAEASIRELAGLDSREPLPPTNAVVPRDFSSVASPSDKMLVLDSAWSPRHTKAFREAKGRGVDIYTLVHDLIPLTAAGAVSSAASENFYDWLLNSAEYTTRYLANSKATHRDLVAFLQAHKKYKTVTTVPLAQEGVPSGTGHLRNDLGKRTWLETCGELYPLVSVTHQFGASVRHLAMSPYVLCVGTIEARKNLWRLAAAWKTLIDSGRCDIPKLVLAGRRGALRDDLEDFLASTGNLFGWIRVIEGPSDDELAFLYRNCEFAVTVSLFEGWGLPVGEALAYGKTSVVANSTSLPEVGGDLVEYCDPTSVASIAEAIWRLSSDKERRKLLEAKIRATRLRGWSDVAKDVFSAVSVAHPDPRVCMSKQHADN